MRIVTLCKESNEIQRVVALQRNRNKRHKYGEFVIEGRMAIEEAAAFGWSLRSLFYSKDTPLPKWALSFLAEEKADVAYAVSDRLMALISDKSDPAELVAVAAADPKDLSAYTPRLRDVAIVLDEPKSPGNVGMLIRSAKAFGASALILSGHSADEYDPQCVRASVGTFFSLPVYRVAGVEAFVKRIDALRSQYPGVAVVATGDGGALPLPAADWSGSPLFLVLGNETRGVSRGFLEQADAFVKIALPGRFTSLNIAAAGSVFLYEIFSKRCQETMAGE